MIQLAVRHSGWTVGFLDVWWSRFAQPTGIRSWSLEARPLRLVSRRTGKKENQPKALSCYGMLFEDECKTEPQKILLCFVRGRPVSHVMTAFLGWVCEQLEALGKHVWVLIWDNAS